MSSFTGIFSCYNNNVFVWSLLVRIIPTLLFSIWFLTNKSWWRYFIFCPIAPFASTLIVPFTHNNDSLVQHLGAFSLITLIIILIDNKNYFQFAFVTPPKHNMVNSAKIRGLYFKTRSFLTNNIYNQKLSNGIDRIRNLEHLKVILNPYLIATHYIPDNNRISKPKEIIIISLLIIFSTLSWAHIAIPKDQQKLNLLFLSINNMDFPDLPTFVWYITTKLCVIITLSLWIITSKNWWRYAILSPIIFYIYQFWEAFQTGSTALNENEYIKGLPIITILVGILFYLSETIKYQTRIIDTYHTICHDIEVLLDQSKEVIDFRNKNNLRYHQIKKNKASHRNEAEHLKRLHKFKEELTDRINRNDWG